MTAFTSIQRKHEHEGDSTEIEYPFPLLASTSWDETTFTVPADGVYHFAVSFVRDEKGIDPGDQEATTDDTRIDICVDGEMKASAWAGQGNPGRVAGMVAVALRLERGQKVTTKDWADGGVFRRFGNCVFTGHRIS